MTNDPTDCTHRRIQETMYILIYFCFINFRSLFRRPLSRRRRRLSITTKKLYELILCSTTVTPGHGTKVRDTSEDEGNTNLDFFLNRARILLTPHVLSIFLFPLRFFFFVASAMVL